MNDRIPGSSPYNPIKYRGWEISLTQNPYQDGYDYAHESFDGAPDSGDDRCGFARTVAEAKTEIDEYEDALEAFGSGAMK
jgi:hypothetical protein